MKAIKIKFRLFWVNHIFVGTRFFQIKNYLISKCGIKVGKNTKIVASVPDMSKRTLRSLEWR